MNFIRAVLGSVATGGGACLLVLLSQPVHAKAVSAAPFASTAFAGRTDWMISSQETPKKDAPKDDIPLPDGEGKDTAKRLCSTCHSTNVWANQRHTGEKWGQIVDNMVSKGLEASDDDLAIVTDYLGKNLAPAAKDVPHPASPPQR